MSGIDAKIDNRPVEYKRETRKRLIYGCLRLSCHRYSMRKDGIIFLINNVH